MNQKSIWGIFPGSLWIIFGLLAGCVYDGMDDCPVQSGIYITVSVLSGNDASSPVKDAVVYFFDSDNRYVGNLEILESQINDQVSVKIPEEFETSYRAVVWGNMGDGMSYPSPHPGDAIEELMLRLQEDVQGLAMPADDLYYGITQLAEVYNRIIVSPITSSVTITVRGVAAQAQSLGYFFTFDTHYGGYDFTGNPIPAEMSIKMPGEFKANNDLVTPVAYHVIHYPDPPAVGAESIAISLWSMVDGVDDPRLLFSEVEIEIGGLARLQSGQTLHILIYYTIQDELQVSVAVTEWWRIHQWI